MEKPQFRTRVNQTHSRCNLVIRQLGFHDIERLKVYIQEESD